MVCVLCTLREGGGGSSSLINSKPFGHLGLRPEFFGVCNSKYVLTRVSASSTYLQTTVLVDSI